MTSEIVRIENANPEDASSFAELDRANPGHVFDLTAAEALDAEAFAKRLEFALVGGDRASVFAYRMAGQRKGKESRGASPWTGYLARRPRPGRGAPRRRDLGGEPL